MKTLIRNATIVINGKQFAGHILIDGSLIKQVSEDLPRIDEGTQIIDAQHHWVIPGIIDEHVHFRDPGLTHKADIASESRAAVAGGVTSTMDMPNVNPQTTTNYLLEERKQIAAEKSMTNYAFYLGATNNNIDEIMKADTTGVCGIKVFMGSSTGNMLVDHDKMLESIFAEAPCLVAVHCEDEQVIKSNLAKYSNLYGDNIAPEHHPLIRTSEACYLSSAKAVELATKHGTHLHIAHLTTARELSLLSNAPRGSKHITAETCPHYLYFDDSYYQQYGFSIKCNPAIKTSADRQALIDAIADGRIDTIATDHAPHLPQEKFGGSYLKSASGIPTIQHSLQAMLELCSRGVISIENIVDKMCHAPADIYHIDRRGYLQAGYFADIVIIDPNMPQIVDKQNILYKCGWSPFEGHTFSHSVTHTFVNGELAYCNGVFNNNLRGLPLHFGAQF